MDMRVDDVLISAEEGCQAAARARQERSGPGHRPRATPDHHRRVGAAGQSRLWYHRSLRSTCAARSCLTRAGHRPVAWPH